MRRELAAILLAGCAHVPIAPDRDTGPDGESDGAQEMRSHTGAYWTDGVVAYGRGDRVDWSWLALPPGDVADLEVVLRWHPQDHGDALGVIVYDEAGRELAHVKGPRAVRGHAGEVSVPVRGASGKVLFAVYALKRRDGGRYALEVIPTFRVDPLQTMFEAAWITAGDPPPLGAVPIDCMIDDGFSYDADHHCNPPRPAIQQCPVPPDPMNPACAKLLP